VVLVPLVLETVECVVVDDSVPVTVLLAVDEDVELAVSVLEPVELVVLVAVDEDVELAVVVLEPVELVTVTV